MRPKNPNTPHRCIGLAFLLTLSTLLIAAGGFAQDTSVKKNRAATAKVPRIQTPKPMVPNIDFEGLEDLQFDMGQIPFAVDQPAIELGRMDLDIAMPDLSMIEDLSNGEMIPYAAEMAAKADLATQSMSVAPMALARAEAALSRANATFAVAPALAGSYLMDGQDAPSAQESAASKAYQKAYNLILDKKWSDAVKELDSFIGKFSRNDYSIAARYWKCYAREKSGASAEDAFRSYQDFVDKYSHSKWADDAKTNMIRIGSELAKQGKSEYAAIVQSMQQGDDEDVKLTALYALRNTSDEKALPVIIDLYGKSKSEKLRGKIVYVLGSYDSPLVVPKLAEIAVKDPSVMVRKNAVYALGNTKKSEAAAALKQIVKSPTDPDIRTTALYSLANLGDADMIPYLTDIATTDSNVRFATTATYTIGNANNEQSTKALETILKKAKFKEVRKAALHTLANHPDETTIEVLKQIALSKSDNEDDPDMQRTAVYALGNIHSGASTAALKEVLSSPAEVRTKIAAIQAIGTGGGSDARDILKKFALSEDDDRLARTAIYAVGNTREGKDTSFYFDVLRNAKSFEVRKAALNQLADIQSASTVKTVGQIAKDEKDEELKVAAIYVLGNLHNDDAVGILLDIAQKDANKRARTAAVSALSNIGTQKAQDALLQILEGKSKDQ